MQRPPRGDTPAERVADVLRRASRALERAAARDEGDAHRDVVVRRRAPLPLKHEIDATLRAIIADAVDGDGTRTFADLDDIVRVLGSVWFAELTYWSNGLNPSSSMGDNLASRALSSLLGYAVQTRARTSPRIARCRDCSSRSARR